jgi:hypothetical protein
MLRQEYLQLRRPPSFPKHRQIYHPTLLLISCAYHLVLKHPFKLGKTVAIVLSEFGGS